MSDCMKFKGWHELVLFLGGLNPFPHDKISDQTKLTAFADNKLNVTKMIISVFVRVENIVGKGEIAYTSNFSFSHNVFKRLFYQTCQKVSLCGNGLNPLFEGQCSIINFLPISTQIEFFIPLR